MVYISPHSRGVLRFNGNDNDKFNHIPRSLNSLQYNQNKNKNHKFTDEIEEEQEDGEGRDQCGDKVMPKNVYLR